MSKFAGFIIGAIEIGIGIVTGNVALIVQGGMTIAAQAIVDLTAPKTPAREASEMTIKLGETSRAMQVGETYTPGSLVDGFDYGGKYGTDWEVLIIRLADHACEGLTGFYVNDEYNLYAGDGLVPRYDDQFKIYFRANTSIDPLPDIVLDNGPGWTAADIGQSGCDVIVAYKADKDKDKHPGWPGGRPHFGFVLKGKLCYDLRKDDTVVGGSGPHRWTDPSTWEWSENAIICWSNFERGVFADDDVSDPTKLLVGRGLTADELPPDDLVIAAANLCDEDAHAPLRLDVKEAPHYGLNLGAFSRDFSRFVTLDAAGLGFYAIWDVYSRTPIKTGGMPCAVGTFVFTAENNIYIRPDATHVRTLTSGLASAGLVTLLANPANDIYYAGGFGCLTALTGHNYAQLYDGGVVLAIDVGFKVLGYARGPDNLPWALGVSGTDIKLAQLVSGAVGTTLTVANVAGGGAQPYGLPNSAGNLCLLQGATTLVIDITLGTILHSAARAGAVGRETIINHDGSDTIWSQNNQYSLLDGSLIQTVTYADWGVGLGTDMYDPVNNALFGRQPAAANVNWLFLKSATRYRVAGPIYANQPYLDVEQMFAAATAGSILTREGAVFIEPGQAKSVVATFTDADMVSGSKVSWNEGFLSDSSDEWLNTVVPTYVEPAQKWNSHSAPPVRNPADIIADGKPREAQLALRLVRDQPQAQHIAEVARRKGRLWGRGTVTLLPDFCELEDGDWVAWQSDRRFGGATKTCRVRAYLIDEKWQNTLTLEEIAASVFADDGVFAEDNSASTPNFPPIDIGAPDSGSWAMAATTLVSAGASVPALTITGAATDDDNVQSIIVEYWKDDGVTTPPTTAAPDGVPWIMAGTYRPDTTEIQITGLTGGATYYVALTYVVSGAAGDRLVMGPETVADLDVSPQLRLAIDPVAGAAYQIAATDGWRHKRFTNAAAIAVTVPTNATAAYPIGARTRLTQAGAGQITLVAAIGVTLNSRDAALKSAGSNAVLEIEKIDTNEWDVLGDVTV